MYVSNQKRQRRYRKERMAENINNENTQIELYKKLAENAEDDVQATQLADLATNVVQKLVEPSKQTGLSKLIQAISDGKLTQFVKGMESIPIANLSTTEKIVQAVMKSQDYKTSVNAQLTTMIEQGQKQPKKIASALINEMMNNKQFLKRVRAQSGESVSSNEELKDVVGKALGGLAEGVNPDLASEYKNEDDIADSETVGMTEDESVEGNFTRERFKKLNKETLLSIFKVLHPTQSEIVVNTKSGKERKKLTYSGKNTILTTELRPIVRNELDAVGRLI
jgi:hypothetical protein